MGLLTPRLFPTILIVLNACASAVYAWNGNPRMAVYWLAAATLNVCILLGDR